MHRFRVPVTHVFASLSEEQWKRHWRESAVAAGYTPISTDDRIVKYYDEETGRSEIFGDVE